LRSMTKQTNGANFNLLNTQLKQAYNLKMQVCC